MKIYRIRSFDEFTFHAAKNKLSIEEHHAYLERVTPLSEKTFTVPGYSYTAGKQVQFLVDFQHAGANGRVNWRERVCCPETYFNLNPADQVNAS